MQTFFFFRVGIYKIKKSKLHFSPPLSLSLAHTHFSSLISFLVLKLHPFTFRMVCIRLVPYVTFDSHCFHFDVVERNLDQYIILKLGRYNTSRRLSSNRLSFKSKVVSRAHAEMYADEDGKVKEQMNTKTKEELLTNNGSM